MKLQKYHEKRNFGKTPEPEGKEIKHKGKLEFVVQEHHASHLHYDFRLELDGVLKSWAVPKGPSRDPHIKRLAMMVEDHPYSYRTFSGTIPKGNYGAGTVKIWDHGTYESTENPQDSERALRRGLKEGDIKFRLFGKKLKGLWALVKMKSEKDNTWLLIKEKDTHASSEDEKFQALTKGLKKEKIPEFIQPMLATTVDKPFDNKNWIFEIKWDGYRAIADIQKHTVNFYSRNNKSFVESYPEIVTALQSFSYDAVLDGEVVVVDEKGKPSFQQLQNFKKNRKGNLLYYVFDVLFLNGVNLMEKSLLERKKILKGILPESPIVKISTHIKEDGKAFFAAAKKQHLEGIMAKKIESAYQPGQRGNDWLKIKTSLRQEAIICGYTNPQGGRKYFGALILGVYKNKVLTYVGHTGSGFSEDSLKELHTVLHTLKTKSCPFQDVPETNAPVTWVKPKLVCEVAFQEWTENGIMRIPIFEGLREDKEIDEVAVEEVEDISQPVLHKKDEMKEKIGKVLISHPDKILFPKDGYTKGDLFTYYKEVSPFILPYLKDRPLSLLRYPQGIDEKGFFQKDITFGLPDFAKSVKIHSDSEDKKINYLVCQNEETLIYMINLDCIDIHPWNSSIGSLEKPDYLIFDLDPLGVHFEKVVAAALEMRKVLESIGIESFPKTSGATGMHIYVPTAAKYTYEQVKQFAELIVTIVHKKHPEFTSIERNPSKRDGKVYLDFLQNRVGQTVAAPYSVRPRPKAPVSTPLHWDEVRKDVKPENFTVKTVLRRLHKTGDIWKPVLKKGIDISQVLKKLSTD